MNRPMLSLHFLRVQFSPQFNGQRTERATLVHLGIFLKAQSVPGRRNTHTYTCVLFAPLAFIGAQRPTRRTRNLHQILIWAKCLIQFSACNYLRILHGCVCINWLMGFISRILIQNEERKFVKQQCSGQPIGVFSCQFPTHIVERVSAYNLANQVAPTEGTCSQIQRTVWVRCCRLLEMTTCEKFQVEFLRNEIKITPP